MMEEKSKAEIMSTEEFDPEASVSVTNDLTDDLPPAGKAATEEKDDVVSLTTLKKDPMFSNDEQQHHQVEESLRHTQRNGRRSVFFGGFHREASRLALQTYTEIVEEWAGGTSVHGMANATAVSEYQRWYRFMWKLLVLVGLIVLGWQIAQLVTTYTKYEVTTDSQILNPKTIEFPDVTLCNQAFFSHSRFDLSYQWPSSFEELDRISMPWDPQVLYASYNGRVLISKTPLVPGPTSSLDDVNEHFSIVTTDMGRCLRFSIDEKIVRPTSQGGLDIVLWTNQDDYHPMYAHTVGYKLMVEQRGSVVNPETPLYILSPGRRYDVHLSKHVFDREPETPWSRCNPVPAPEYTQARCRMDCVFKNTREECGCSNWGDEDPDALKTTPYCHTKNQTICNNVGDYSKRNQKALSQCFSQCELPPCQEVVYDKSISDAKLHSAFLNFAPQAYNKSEVDFPDNYLEVHINFDKMQYQKLTEGKAMTRAQFLANIGGSLGLCLGISALSVYEVFGDLLMLRILPRMFGYRQIGKKV